MALRLNLGSIVFNWILGNFKADAEIPATPPIQSGQTICVENEAM